MLPVVAKTVPQPDVASPGEAVNDPLEEYIINIVIPTPLGTIFWGNKDVYLHAPVLPKYNDGILLKDVSEAL